MQPAKKTDQNAGTRLLAALEEQFKCFAPESHPVDVIALPAPAKDEKKEVSRD